MITGHLESDRDVCSLSATCSKLQIVVRSEPVWRQRLSRYFDPPNHIETESARQLYCHRRAIIVRPPLFLLGRTAREIVALHLIQILIIGKAHLSLSFSSGEWRQVQLRLSARPMCSGQFRLLILSAIALSPANDAQSPVDLKKPMAR